LHDDPVHHDHEAGRQNDNDRWTWMQNEIQRISIEQQRQCDEISRLRGDVQRGNRMHEQNNRMLVRMMQHLYPISGLINGLDLISGLINGLYSISVLIKGLYPNSGLIRPQ
jgi:hypothetical protein